MEEGPAFLWEADGSKSVHIGLALPSHGLHTVKTADLYTQATIREVKISAFS